MDISAFIQQSIGHWRTQRSAHHLAFAQFEAVHSTISIEALSVSDPVVLALCKDFQVDPQLAVHPFRMHWESLSDWDEQQQPQVGSAVLVPVPDPIHSGRGRLLRNQGYAEAIPAVGHYSFTDDGTFVLLTPYDHAVAEEKIWFVHLNLRCRVSLIKTSAGTGVLTASFSSEIRTTAAG